MTEIDEKLSRVMDEYQGSEACKAVLDEVVDDVNLQYQMRRYQMIGDVMRHELPTQINLDFSHQIMAQVRDIQTELNPRPTVVEKATVKTSFWNWAGLKPLAGIAVAASVAVVSITLWQTVSLPGSDGSDGQVASSQQQKIDNLASQSPIGTAAQVSSQLNNGTRWTTIEDSPALQRKLNAYLVNHTEYAVPIQGLIPQARVAGFDSQE